MTAYPLLAARQPEQVGAARRPLVRPPRLAELGEPVVEGGEDPLVGPRARPRRARAGRVARRVRREGDQPCATRTLARAARKPAFEARAARRPGRLARWRERVRGDADGGGGAVVGLAVVAVGVEAASMLPYLAAIALLATSGLGAVPTVALLAGYCLVMVLPALVLLALRAALHDRLTPALARLESRLSRASGEAVAWVLFLLGLYVVVDAFPLT